MKEREQPTTTRELAGTRNSGTVAAGPTITTNRNADAAGPTIVGASIDTMVSPMIDAMVGSPIESSRFRSQPTRDARSRNVRQSVELHIDELVLHGFEPAQRYAIGDAVERELARLFNERGLPPGTGEAIEIAEVDGGTIYLSPGSNDEATGRQLARVIYGGLVK